MEWWWCWSKLRWQVSVDGQKRKWRAAHARLRLRRHALAATPSYSIPSCLDNPLPNHGIKNRRGVRTAVPASRRPKESSLTLANLRSAHRSAIDVPVNSSQMLAGKHLRRRIPQLHQRCSNCSLKTISPAPRLWWIHHVSRLSE